MLIHPLRAAVCLFAGGLCALGQEAASGISVPVAVSGDAAYTPDGSSDPGRNSVTGGFRAVISPALKLGPHWFVYSTIEAYSSGYFSYPPGPYEVREVNARVTQAFAGYTTRISHVSLLIKAGQLSSAFGLFPMQYDDAAMPLIDAPASYIANLPLRPDQRPCGVSDLLRQDYDGDVAFGCGGSQSERYGQLPVTLYGLPAVEADLSVARFDARVQVTNSSPANPHPLTSGSQFAQWTAGAGYTVPGGLHLGASGFRGPYLDRTLLPYLPAGAGIGNFLASGIGLDAAWARGPWSLEGEWQQFRFDLPGFVISPSETSQYLQAKRNLSPRVFVAARATAFHFGRIRDDSGISANRLTGAHQVYEIGGGYRFSRVELLKFEFNWTRGMAWSEDNWYWPSTNDRRLELQLVTSFTPVSKVFR